MSAPQRIAQWLCNHRHVDRKFGRTYHYHPRSDSHSKALCQFVLEDLLAGCEALCEQARRDRVVYKINARYQWPASRKRKTLDLAIGTGKQITDTHRLGGVICQGEIDRVLISCEAKTVMTEHGKSQPRIFDELSSSHDIVHQGEREAIAGGITVVNIADSFVSPLRNQRSGEPLQVSRHNQPHVTERMVTHLRGLPIRDDVKGTGFDAYTTIVVSCTIKPTTPSLSGPARLRHNLASVTITTPSCLGSPERTLRAFVGCSKGRLSSSAPQAIIGVRVFSLMPVRPA